MIKKHHYTSPQADALEMKPSSMVLTSTIDSLAIDETLGSIDEVSFTDFNQVF